MSDNPMRAVAIDAAKAALLAEEWEDTFPESAHAEHRHWARCAICDRDVDRLVPVALDAADRALAAFADAAPTGPPELMGASLDELEARHTAEGAVIRRLLHGWVPDVHDHDPHSAWVRSADGRQERYGMADDEAAVIRAAREAT